MVIAEYVWIDGYGKFRSKIKILESCSKKAPIWNFNGSFTRQGTIDKSEVVLNPVFTCQNPFYDSSNENLLVLCETMIQDDSGTLHQHPTNTRHPVQAKFAQGDLEHRPWFGIEQEYYITNIPATQKHGNYYCGVDILGREIAEQHMNLCLKAGLVYSGMNAEAGPGQWEYQIGPVPGIAAVDQLIVSRYILERVAEKNHTTVSYHPKYAGEEFPGSGLHINYSTLQTRQENGLGEIHRIIRNLETEHLSFVKLCGLDSEKRLTGDHETSTIRGFSWGIASRNTSIRIPRDTYITKRGYLEDRRPSANAEPYTLCALYLDATNTF